MATEPGPSSRAPRVSPPQPLATAPPTSQGSLLASIENDARLSLSQIYRSLPSPCVPPELECPQPDDIHTPLFAYQLRSLSLMLLREQPARKGTDPRYLDVEGQPLDAETHMLIDGSSPPSDYIQCHAVNGGILSEEMGAGKTLIILACILSTRGSLPYHDPTKLTSSICDRFKGIGVPCKKDSVADQKRSSRPLAPLTAVTAHTLGQDGYTDADDPEGILPHPLRELLQMASPYYLLTAPNPARKPRVALPELSMRVYLSSATLVVVPRTLLRQWKDEIRKHVRPEAKLRLLVLDDGCGEIPSAKELSSQWDIILLTHSRFGAEESGGALQVRWPSVPRKCQCPYIGASRTVDCRCPPPPKLEPQASPLLQCKFRRLVIDEGNVVSGGSSLVKLAARLACQSRWVVSGTPTELMTGAAGQVLTTGLEGEEGMGAQTEEQERQEDGIEDRAPAPLTDAEANDLRRLKALVVDFLRLPPFWSSPEEDAPPHAILDWKSTVISPLRAQSLGARTRLRNIMTSTMVRNRPCDLLSLPALHQRTVRLPFTKRERLTHNTLLCLVSINAELSEREGKQWFFHHSNKKPLNEMMINLALACFHFGNDTLANHAADTLRRAQDGVGDFQRQGREVPRALFVAIEKLQEAVEDPSWRWGQSEFVRFSTNLADGLRKAFDSSSSYQWSDADGKALLKADELCALQICAEKSLSRARRDSSGGWGAEEVFEELITAGERWKRGEVVRAEKKSEGSRSGAAGRGRASTAANGPSTVTSAGSETHPELIPPELATAVLNGASSTKMVHILDLILRMPDGDKAIVFSELSGILYELAGALQACSINASYHAPGTAQAKRDEAIARFKVDPEVKVLLMGARVGGRGIDLSCANHVIFVSPINDAALKLQALKRAYRTGQTKETHVTTFVMLDSFEDHLASSGPRRAKGDIRERRKGEAQGGSESEEARRLLAKGPNGDEEEMRMPRVLLYPRLAQAHKSEREIDAKRRIGIVGLQRSIHIFPALERAVGKVEEEGNEMGKVSEEDELAGKGAEEAPKVQVNSVEEEMGPVIVPQAAAQRAAGREQQNGSAQMKRSRSRSQEWIQPPSFLEVNGPIAAMPPPVIPQPVTPQSHRKGRNGIDSHMAPQLKPHTIFSGKDQSGRGREAASPSPSPSASECDVADAVPPNDKEGADQPSAERGERTTLQPERPAREEQLIDDGADQETERKHRIHGGGAVSQQTEAPSPQNWPEAHINFPRKCDVGTQADKRAVSGDGITRRICTLSRAEVFPQQHQSSERQQQSSHLSEDDVKRGVESSGEKELEGPPRKKKKKKSVAFALV